jgi:hypothetical protein
MVINDLISQRLIIIQIRVCQIHAILFKYYYNLEMQFDIVM